MAVVIHSLGRGGAERVAVELARRWTDDGDEVRIMTVAPADTDFYRPDPRVLVVRLNQASSGSGVVSRLVQGVRRVVQLRRALREFRPDVTLGMMSSAAMLVALASLGLPGIKVGSERTYPPSLPLGKIHGLARVALYGALDLVVAQTSQGAHWLDRNTWARSVTVVPNAVVWPMPDLPPTLDPNSLGGAGRQIVLSVGRLDGHKGFADLLGIFHELSATRPDWDLVILGDGPDRGKLEAEVERLGLQGRAFLPGPAGNVADWYRRAAVFALTSKVEGFPNALLEAMAHGCACVSYDCLTGPRDLITSGVDGLLVSAGDNTAFVAALASVMDQPERRVALAAKAGSVRSRYSQTRVSLMWRNAFLAAQHARNRRGLFGRFRSDH